MIVPGSNLLNLALTVQGKQQVVWFAHAGTVTTAAGIDQPDFAEGVPLWGSFQPVAVDRVARLGLDMSKRYATFFVSHSFAAVERPPEAAPDECEGPDGRRYSVAGKADWIVQDGWNAVLLVEVAPA